MTKAKSIDSAGAAMDDNLYLENQDSAMGLGMKRMSSAAPEEAVTLSSDEKVEL